MLIGYARVSTEDQHLDLQHDALAKAGCGKTFEDKRSGAKADRPGLAAALEYARAGDQLVVWRLDRLGRSLSDLIALVRKMDEAGVQLRSLTEGIDTSTINGKLTFHLFAALAEFERALSASGPGPVSRLPARVGAWAAASTGCRRTNAATRSNSTAPRTRPSARSAS